MTPTARRLWVGLWLVLAVGLVVRTGIRDRGVITDHLEFGRRLFAGADLYAPFEDDGPLHSVYPPSFGLLTAPFTLLPARAARFAWGVLQVAALGAIAAALLEWLRSLRPELVARRDLLWFLTLVLASRYVLRDTHGGGGNTLNLALALLAFRAAEAGRALPTALWLGVSLATKPTTAVLVPVFVALGHVRGGLGSVVVAAALTAIAAGVHAFAAPPGATTPVGFAAVGYWAEGAFAYATRDDVFAPAPHDLPAFTWMNQSLRCAVARFCGAVPAEQQALVPGFVAGFGWSATTTAWIARALGAGVLGVALVAARHGRATFAGRAHALAIGLAAGLLLSPISWKAHHVVLIPALYLVAVAGLRHERGARALAVGYFVVCVAGGGDLVGGAAKEWQQSLYLATAGTVALLGWLAARVRTAADDGPTEPLLPPGPIR